MTELPATPMNGGMSRLPETRPEQARDLVNFLPTRDRGLLRREGSEYIGHSRAAVETTFGLDVPHTRDTVLTTLSPRPDSQYLIAFTPDDIRAWNIITKEEVAVAGKDSRYYRPHNDSNRLIGGLDTDALSTWTPSAGATVVADSPFDWGACTELSGPAEDSAFSVVTLNMNTGGYTANQFEINRRFWQSGWHICYSFHYKRGASQGNIRAQVITTEGTTSWSINAAGELVSSSGSASTDREASVQHYNGWTRVRLRAVATTAQTITSINIAQNRASEPADVRLCFAALEMSTTGRVPDRAYFGGPRLSVGTVPLPEQGNTMQDVLRFAAYGDSLFVVNRRKSVRQIASVTGAGLAVGQGFIHIWQAGYRVGYEVKITTTAVPTGLTFYVATPNHPDNTDTALSANLSANETPEAVAEALAALINAETGLTSTSNGALVTIVPASGAVTTITCRDTVGHRAAVGICIGGVIAYDLLPNFFRHGFRFPVTGSADTNLDDYWVEFRSESGNAYGEGRYYEIAAPGSGVGLRGADMPHRIVIQQDGSLSFEVAPWALRTAGDNTTNPDPPFLGGPITDICFHAGRMALASDLNVTMSDSRDPFALYFPSARHTSPSDPIRAVVEADRGGRIQKLHSTPSGLIVVTDSSIMRLHSGEESWTSAAVRSERVAGATVSGVSRSVMVGESVVYITRNQAGLATPGRLELAAPVQDNFNLLSYPCYDEETGFFFVMSDTGMYALMLAEESAAWARFDLHDTIAITTIDGYLLAAEIIDGTLVVSRLPLFYAGAPSIDLKRPASTVYDPQTDLTTILLAEHFVDADRTIVWNSSTSHEEQIYSIHVANDEESSATSIILLGDLTGYDLIVGRRVDASANFPLPEFRQRIEGEGVVSRARYRPRDLVTSVQVATHGTTAWSATIEDRFRATPVRLLTQTVASFFDLAGPVRERQLHNIPCGFPADGLAELRIRTSSPYPLNFLTLQWSLRP